MTGVADRSESELFDECLQLSRDEAQDRDHDRRREIIGELSSERVTRSIFDRALALAASSQPFEVCAGIDVLNDFGPSKNFPWREETIEVLVNALSSDNHHVVRSALSALGRFGPSEATADVVKHATSHDDAIRLATAMALPRFVHELDSDESQSVVRTLMLLMADESSAVRDWSTFGLGIQTNADSAEVRSALLSRLDDPGSNARHEALVAMARRHDRRALPALIEAIEADEVAYLAIQAAEILGAPELLPALRQLAQSPNWSEEELDFAIRRCNVDAQDVLIRQLNEFMQIAHANFVDLTCFSDRVPVDSGGPQIAYSDKHRYLTWSFEELLDRANGNPQQAAELVATDLREEGVDPAYELGRRLVREHRKGR